MASPSPRYVALIGDLVASRDLAPKVRKDLQRYLKEWLQVLNDEFAKELAAPLTLTAGDEIQGLLRKPAALVPVVQDLMERMFLFESQPRMLWGAGCGLLTTGRIPAPPRQADSPALLDGPAFHNARAALEAVQDLGGWVRFVGFVARGGHEIDAVLDGLFTLMGSVRERWTTNQARMSRLMRKASNPSQRLLAEQLKVSPSVVSETLKAARHSAMLEGEQAAIVLLEALEAVAR